LDLKNYFALVQDLEIIRKVVFSERHMVLSPLITLETEKRAISMLMQDECAVKEFDDQGKNNLDSQDTHLAHSRVSCHTSRVYVKSSKWHDMIQGTIMGEKDSKKCGFSNAVVTIAGQSPMQSYQPLAEQPPVKLLDSWK
jgi:hypothetical protein